MQAFGSRERVKSDLQRDSFTVYLLTFYHGMLLVRFFVILVSANFAITPLSPDGDIGAF